MIGPSFQMALRLRLRSSLLTAVGMASVIVMVGALFPAVGGSIGKLDLPEGVAELLGGADYGTIVGWMRSEIGAVYGPLVIAAIAITAAASSTAGEEEEGILALVLAHPISRARLLFEKVVAVAVAVAVLIIALGTMLGLVVGVAIAGGGIGIAHIIALAIHLACFGLMVGALALALAASTGRRAVAVAGAATFALLGFLVNGFAPLVDGLTWLKYFSPFHYYSGNDPLTSGIDLSDLTVLVAAALALTATAALTLSARDLRT